MLNMPLLYAAENIYLPNLNNKNLARDDEVNDNLVIPQSVVRIEREGVFNSKARRKRKWNQQGKN